MYPYITVFFTLVFFSLIAHYREIKKNEKYIVIVITILLILFSGLRFSGTGSDDWSYIIIFDKVNKLSDALFSIDELNIMGHHMEYGYILLNSVVKSFSDNYMFLFLCTAFISVGFSSYNYLKYSPYIFLTLLLFFVHTYLYRDMNQIRAAIAASISLFSIRHIEDKNHAKFYIVMFFSSLFHIASLIIFIPYLLSLTKFTKFKSLFFVILGFVLGGLSISTIIINNFPLIGSVTQTLNNYAESEYNSRSLGLFNITNIKVLAIYVFSYFYYDRLEKKLPYFRTIFIFYTLDLAWRFAFNDFAILAGRLATFFEIIEVILIPSYILIFKNKRIATLVIIFYASAVFYMNIFIIERIDYKTSLLN